MVNRLPLRVGWAVVPLALTLALTVYQLAVHSTVYRSATWNTLWELAGSYLVFVLALQLGNDVFLLMQALRAFTIFAFLLSVQATLQLFTSDGKIFWLFPSGYTDYVLGPFVYRNHYVAFIELALPVALYLSFFSFRNRTAYSIMAAVMFSSVVAAASRAGLLLVSVEIVAVPAMVIFARKTSLRTAVAPIGKFAALATVAALVVGLSGMWQRLVEADPLFLRGQVLVSALEMIGDRPIAGFGMGTWAVAYPGYASFDPGSLMNQAHNDWAQLSVEGGVPALALMMLFAGMLVRPALRTIWGLGVLVVLIHCLADYPLHQRPALAGVFYALAGAVCAHRTTEARFS
ncbi:MAG: O-antigen ligase family protein [Bryobacterales bacterium]|nr:O-antigen ligase family protein [Bryobacterales bacterium]